MTETQLRTKVASWLGNYVGCAEGSAKHKEILKVFNNSGLCTRYTMTVNDAWCATAVSAAFIALGLAGKPGSGKLFECVDCGCDRVIAMAKTQGIWVENDAYVPGVGDVILYAWSDSGYGDCYLSSDHIGIVVSVSGGTIRVIEGNISNTVGYRNIAVNGRYIRGYVTPNYAKFASGGTTVTTPVSTATTSSTSTSTSSNTTTTYDNVRNLVNAFGGQKKWTNGSTEEIVYCDSAKTVTVGSLDPRDTASCIGVVDGMYVVLYKIDGSANYKVGLVDYRGGLSSFKPTGKTWRNGSTDEPVYADVSCTKEVGSLNPYEVCDCIGTYSGKYIVYYKVDGKDSYKVGVVAYSGGL